jgi:hypothetical protein
MLASFLTSSYRSSAWVSVYSRMTKSSRMTRSGQQLARAQAAARAPYPEGLIGHTDELWQQVEALVATKRQADYTAAVKLVQDLHDVSARQRQLDTFTPRLQQLRARQAKKVSLLNRFDLAQLA